MTVHMSIPYQKSSRSGYARTNEVPDVSAAERTEESADRENGDDQGRLARRDTEAVRVWSRLSDREVDEANK